ncbi:MAG: ABC transporter substrate-binding protein [Pyrinomonadaceae bacterium]
MTTTNTQPAYVILRPFDTVYAIVFTYFLLDYLTSKICSVIDHQLNSSHSHPIDSSGFQGIVVILSTIQLVRMYYYLEHFEVIIRQRGRHHFLEILPYWCEVSEKLLRLVLVLILILFTKLNLYGFPSQAILSICFLLLITWDLIVITGLNSSFTNGSISETQAVTNARMFFYIRNNEFNKDYVRKRNYVRLPKSWERLGGILASVSASIHYYTYGGIESHETGLWMIPVIVGVGMMAISFYKGRLRVRQAEDKGSFKNFLGPLFAPVFAIFANLNLIDRNSAKEFKKMNTKLFYGCVIAIVALVVGIVIYKYWWTGNCGDYFSSNCPKVVKIATSKNLWCGLTLIAVKKEFFQQEGLSPDVSYQAAGRLNMDALLGGAVDFANVVETNIAYQALNNTQDIKVHSRIVEANDYVIITNGPSNIKQPADLKGKSLIFAQATGAESFVFWFMEKHNLSKDSVKLSPLQPAALVDNFLNGQSDSVASWEPFASTIRSKKQDLGESFYSDSLGFKGIMTVATKKSWADQNRKVVEAYNRAMEKAAAFARENPAEAQEIISGETGIPLETVKNIWGRFDFNYVTTLDKEKILVMEVIRRIKMMIPDMTNKKEADVSGYF